MAIFRHLFDPLNPSGSSPYDKVVSEAEFSRFMDNNKTNGKEQHSLECI
jgi:hypothetical protein